MTLGVGQNPLVVLPIFLFERGTVRPLTEYVLVGRVHWAHREVRAAYELSLAESLRFIKAEALILLRILPYMADLGIWRRLQSQ
jgi:hypothetical protein